MINKKRLKKISAAGMTAMFLLSGIPVYAEELPDQDIIIEETETLEQETVAETDARDRRDRSAGYTGKRIGDRRKKQFGHGYVGDESAGDESAGDRGAGNGST